MLFATLEIRRNDYDFALARKLIATWRKAAGLLLHGDYYPLTPFHRSPERWVARQFDAPEAGRGLVQAIRPPDSPQERRTFFTKAIEPEAEYRFEDSATGEIRQTDGQALIRDGFTIALPPRSGAIWFYQTIHS